MTRPTFGKMKTIVLPVPSTDYDPITTEEYKEKYGIDIEKFIKLEAGNILIDLPENTLLLISFADPLLPGFNNPITIPVVSSHSVTRSESDDAQLVFGVYDFDQDTTVGIVLSIAKEETFNMSNVRITGFGI